MSTKSVHHCILISTVIFCTLSLDVVMSPLCCDLLVLPCYTFSAAGWYTQLNLQSTLKWCIVSLIVLLFRGLPLLYIIFGGVEITAYDNHPTSILEHFFPLWMGLFSSVLLSSHWLYKVMTHLLNNISSSAVFKKIIQKTITSFISPECTVHIMIIKSFISSNSPNF